MDQVNSHTRFLGRNAMEPRSQGLTLIEIAISLSIIGVLLLGVMASLTTGLSAQAENRERLTAQYLVRDVLEEIQDNDFANLLSFDGLFVTEGAHQADISVSLVNTNLMRVQVSTTSTQHVEVSATAVTMISNL
jgi:prepilin-type N-terminal cleavage/methylation domain-containing protein